MAEKYKPPPNIITASKCLWLIISTPLPQTPGQQYVDSNSLTLLPYLNAVVKASTPGGNGTRLGPNASSRVVYIEVCLLIRPSSRGV